MFNFIFVAMAGDIGSGVANDKGVSVASGDDIVKRDLGSSSMPSSSDSQDANKVVGLLDVGNSINPSSGFGTPKEEASNLEVSNPIGKVSSLKSTSIDSKGSVGSPVADEKSSPTVPQPPFSNTNPKVRAGLQNLNKMIRLSSSRVREMDEMLKTLDTKRVSKGSIFSRLLNSGGFFARIESTIILADRQKERKRLEDILEIKDKFLVTHGGKNNGNGINSEVSKTLSKEVLPINIKNEKLTNQSSVENSKPDANAFSEDVGSVLPVSKSVGDVDTRAIPRVGSATQNSSSKGSASSYVEKISSNSDASSKGRGVV